MASKKSKILAIAFCAAVMAGIHVNPVLAAYGDQDFNYQPTKTESGLNNPEIHHTVDKGKFNPDSPVHTDGDVNCKEEVANSNITVGDMNKVTADLVANDEKIYSDVKELKGQVGKGDTDTHVKEGAATVDDNGNVTMDIVDKNDKDTGKNVTISGLASDKELEGVKKELQQQINSIDVEDTNTQINEDTYTAEADGTVNMDVVDKVTGEVTKNAVTIEGLASDKELATETQKRTEADTKLQGQINANANAIATETQKRTEADTKLQGQINANANAIATETQKRTEADTKLQGQINANANAIATETQKRTEADTKLQGQINANANAIATETQKRTEADTKLQGQINANATAIATETQNRTDADTKLQGQINANANAIATETQKRTEADTKLQGQINANANAIATETQKRTEADTKLQANINAEAEAREKADADLQADINAKEKQSKYRDEQLQQSIDNHEKVMGVTDKTGLETAYEGATYIDKNDTMVEADRKLDAAISDVNSRVDGIESRVDGLEGRIDKVGAMSAAIANLRTMGYDPAAPTEVAVGVGQYRDETGMALGLFHYPNRDFMLSLSVSTSGDEYMGGIGATWKFGRKSPEKVAEIKKAQAEADARRAEEQKLAKAEEMKKAAKEAKVQAQMERHAKLAA